MYSEYFETKKVGVMLFSAVWKLEDHIKTILETYPGLVGIAAHQKLYEYYYRSDSKSPYYTWAARLTAGLHSYYKFLFVSIHLTGSSRRVLFWEKNTFLNEAQGLFI